MLDDADCHKEGYISRKKNNFKKIFRDATMWPKSE